MTFFMSSSTFLAVYGYTSDKNRIHDDQQCNYNIIKRFTYHQDSSDDFSYILVCN